MHIFSTSKEIYDTGLPGGMCRRSNKLFKDKDEMPISQLDCIVLCKGGE